MATLRSYTDAKVILNIQNIIILLGAGRIVRCLYTYMYPLDTRKAGGIVLANMHKPSGNTLEGKMQPMDE